MKNGLKVVLLLATAVADCYQLTAQALKEGLWATDNNVIELRNDSLGDQFYRVLLSPFPVEPQSTYYMPPGEGEWQTTTGVYSGRRLPESIVWPVEVIYQQGDGLTPGTNNIVFKDRNIPPPGSYRLITGEKERGNHISTLSREFGDFEKDYAFMVQTRNKILELAGLDANSSEWDKVNAFAVYCYEKRKKGKGQLSRFMHPVDFCIHGDGEICVAAANTFAALCSTIDVPTRLVAFSHHTNAEVFLDGKWRFCENAIKVLEAMKGTGKENQSLETGPLFSFSFLEMIEDPVGLGFSADTWYKDFTCVADSKGKPGTQVFYEAHPNWIFHFYGMLKDAPLYNVAPTFGSARELRVLYPGEKQLTYKSDSLPRMWLTPHRNWVAGENHGNMMVIDQGAAVRQTFYLSSLENVRSVTAYLPVPRKFLRSMPEDGGAWYYLVNGRKMYVKELGGWKYHRNTRISNLPCIRLDIPLELLNIE